MPDDGVDDLVGSPGVGEQLGEHGAQRDEDADAGGRLAEAIGERGEHRGEFLARDDTDGDGAEDEPEERVQLHHGDEHDDDRDTGQEGEHQVRGRCDGFDELRCLCEEGCAGSCEVGLHRSSSPVWLT